MLCTKVLMFLFMQNLNCFRPLSRQIGSYTQILQLKTPKNNLFPSPLKVDRFLYQNSLITRTYASCSFRPLARWIGSYTKNRRTTYGDHYDVSVPYRGEQVVLPEIKNEFKRTQRSRVSGPSRGGQVLIQISKHLRRLSSLFPAPLEVDRFLYQSLNYIRAFWSDLFPSPREVDRLSYQGILNEY